MALFREQAARMDALLLDRLGDRALLEDGRSISGEFFSPFFGDQMKTAGRVKLGAVASTDEVTEPTFTMRLVDAVGIRKDSRLNVQLSPDEGGGWYVITKQKPDGTGLVSLVLRFVNERS